MPSYGNVRKDHGPSTTDTGREEMDVQGIPLPGPPALPGPPQAKTQSPTYFSPPAECDLMPSIQQAYLSDDAFGNPDTATKRWPHMYPRNGLWYHHSGAIAIPDSASLRTDIIAELHESMYAGHPGERRTIHLVKRVFWWPTLDADCRAFVKGCNVCQRDKSSTRKTAGELQQPELAEGKWQTVSLDFITALPVTPRGHNMILTVVDTFSKMVHLTPCKDTLDAEGAA